MVLHRSNIEIPARFSFRPFEARWKHARAELVSWWEKGEEELDLLLESLWRAPSEANSTNSLQPIADRRLGQVIARIEFTEHGALLEPKSSDSAVSRFCLVEMSRSDIPVDVLGAHENPTNAPEIAGRYFPILVCDRADFHSLVPANWQRGAVTKNAWAMREEFLALADDKWNIELRAFLNRWGLWSGKRGFRAVTGEHEPAMLLVLPEKLREQKERYRKALKCGSAHRWLSARNRLYFTTTDKPPYFLVERFFCEEAIETTITIDHLAGRRFGFCKRCGQMFEHENLHKRQYCTRQCIQAAGVQRWREKQKKLSGERHTHHAKRKDKRS